MLRQEIQMIKNSLKNNKLSYIHKLFFLLFQRKEQNNLIFNLYNYIIKLKFYKNIEFIRKYKLKLNLNNYKFTDFFLNSLGKLLSKFYNKKIEFNIIKLRSMTYNADIITEIFKLKLRKQKINIHKVIAYIINKARLPNFNQTRKSKIINSINFNLLENKHEKLNISSILGNDNNNKVNQIFYEIFENVPIELKNVHQNYNKIKDILFNSIKYKKIGGIKLEAKGRLTRRYRAERSLHKVR
jgi:hypothetical protein